MDGGVQSGALALMDGVPGFMLSLPRDEVGDGDIAGSSGRVTDGPSSSSGKFRMGIGGIFFPRPRGSSGALIFGIGGLVSGAGEGPRQNGEAKGSLRGDCPLPPSIVDGSSAVVCTSSNTFSVGRSLKLTIGRPGLSLTIVGWGKLTLRSFRCLLVAARISSPRISSPSLVGVLFGSTSSACPSFAVGGVGGRGGLDM